MAQLPVLLVIDAQTGFRDESYWGSSGNPMAQANIERLVSHWRSQDWPIVLVKHNSKNPESPLNPSQVGNSLESFLEGQRDVVIQKSVNSAFYGTPDLHLWLSKRNFRKLVIAGITTNFCCETTARMAGNLGYEVEFVLDATTAFPIKTSDGSEIDGATVMKMTAANLDPEFAHVVSTDSILS